MFIKIKQSLDRALELLVMAVMGILVIDVLWQVFTRFIIKNPSSWTEELATFLLMWISLLGAAVALNRGAHLGIDYFVSRLSPKKQIIIEIFVFTMVALFSFFVMVVGGIDLVQNTFVLGQVTPALGIKMGYVYLAIPISGFFLTLYSMIALIERIRAAVKGGIKEEELHITEQGTEID